MYKPNNPSPFTPPPCSSCGTLAAGSIARCAPVAVAFEHNVGGLHVIHRVDIEDRVALLKECIAGTSRANENCQSTNPSRLM